LSPLYKGQLLVHGLGYSPDSKTLAVVSVGSNSVTLIETANNKIKGVVYVGRSPHEAFFTPNGRELWVTVRGENYVSVIDPVRMKEVRRIELANGPGMTMFGPDGKYAFVCSSFVPEIAIIDAASHQIVKRLPQATPFSPNIAVTPENDEVWITLKDAGKVQVFSAKPPFAEKTVLDTGPITNHVNFANNRNGKFAYVTIGGANEVKVFRRGRDPAVSRDDPSGRTSAWNLAVGRWFASLCCVGKRRTLRRDRYSHEQSHRQYSDRPNDPSLGLCAKCCSYWRRQRKFDAAGSCRQCSTVAVGSQRKCTAGSSGIGSGKFNWPLGSGSDCGERTPASDHLSSLSCGIQSLAVWEA
jgi:YVTN family beta-propeller protein